MPSSYMAPGQSQTVTTKLQLKFSQFFNEVTKTVFRFISAHSFRVFDKPATKQKERGRGVPVIMWEPGSHDRRKNQEQVIFKGPSPATHFLQLNTSFSSSFHRTTSPKPGFQRSTTLSPPHFLSGHISAPKLCAYFMCVPGVPLSLLFAHTFLSGSLATPPLLSCL